MNSSEIKTILLALVAELHSLQVGQDVILAKLSGSQTLGDLLEAKKAAERGSHQNLEKLRKQIEVLA
jgi:hypothetical protein